MAFQGKPQKMQGRVGVFGNLHALPASEVCKKNETALVVGFKQNGTCGNAAFRIGRRKGHGVGLKQPRIPRLIKPYTELGDRVGIEVSIIEPAGRVFPSEGRDTGVKDAVARVVRRFQDYGETTGVEFTTGGGIAADSAGGGSTIAICWR